MTDRTLPRRRRKWVFRTLALLLPVLALALLELSLRVAGVAAETPWKNPYVDYVSADPYFPQWDETVRMPKPPGTTRIFVLGGSAVMGYKLRPFPNLLPAQLSKRCPGRRFEVINGGMVAFGSHRVVEVLKEAAAYDPDLVLVYTGHNEFLEEIFFDPNGLLARHETVKRFARGLRVVRLLHGVFGEVEMPRPRLPHHFVGNTKFPLIRSREQYELRLEFLDQNLSQMIEFAKARGFGIVLSPAVPNLLYQPGDPVRGPGRNAEWEDWIRKGREAWKAGRDREAADCFAQAAAIEDEDGELAWMRGLADLAKGANEEGLARLTRALDLDRRGNRANSDVARVILARAARDGVPAVDLRPVFARLIPEDFRRMRAGEPSALFLDHCHLAPAGHEVVAAALADALSGLLSSK